jgi:hypothetical protein
VGRCLDQVENLSREFGGEFHRRHGGEARSKNAGQWL